MERANLTAILLGSALLLSACETRNDGAYVTPPEASGASVVQIGVDASVERIEAQLVGLGLMITRKGRSFVEARSTGMADGLVTCGTINQYAFGNTTTFDGGAPVSAVYTGFNPPKLTVRELQKSSRVRVDLQGQTAMVSETHDVTVRWQNAQGERIGTIRGSIGLGESAAFPDNTRCATTGLVSRTIASAS